MKHFIILLTILYPFCLFAQDTTYRPFIEDGKVWVSFNPNSLLGQKWGYTQYDKIEGDTIVNGKPCKFWIQQYFRRLDQYRNTEEHAQTFRIPVYEENKKVWFFMEGDEEPRLAYDFGAEVGEKFPVQSIEGLYIDYYDKDLSDKYVYANIATDTLCYISKDIMEVGGREQKVIHYMSHLLNDEYVTKYVYIIEGIGNNEGPVKNIGPNPPSWNGISQLISCTVGDEVLYYDPEGTDNVASPSLDSSPSTLSPSWHTLSGYKLSSPPTRKGVYIRDGRKVLVK